MIKELQKNSDIRTGNVNAAIQQKRLKHTVELQRLVSDARIHNLYFS